MKLCRALMYKFIWCYTGRMAEWLLKSDVYSAEHSTLEKKRRMLECYQVSISSVPYIPCSRVSSFEGVELLVSPVGRGELGAGVLGSRGSSGAALDSIISPRLLFSEDSLSESVSINTSTIFLLIFSMTLRLYVRTSECTYVASSRV